LVDINLTQAIQAEHKETVVFDRVISCTGFHFDTSIFDESCKPLMCPKGKYPLQDHQWQSSNVPDLYFAGTLTHIHDYRVAASGFIHGFRYNCHALHNILKYNYEGVPLPSKTLPKDSKALADIIIERFNSSGPMYLQTGTMAECLVIKEKEVQYLQNLTTFYFKNGPTSTEDNYLVLSMEYGDINFPNVFDIKRIPLQEFGVVAAYFHPIIRRYHKKELVSEFHLNDNLGNRWDAPHYKASLIEFLDMTFAAPNVRLVCTTENMTFEGKPETAWKKLLQLQAVDLIPHKGNAEYYFKSDYANDVLSLYKCKLD